MSRRDDVQVVAVGDVAFQRLPSDATVAAIADWTAALLSFRGGSLHAAEAVARPAWPA